MGLGACRARTGLALVFFFISSCHRSAHNGPPDKNKDIEELKVAAVGGILLQSVERESRLQVFQSSFQGSSPLWRRCALSVQLATLAFTLYSEYEMTAKADEKKCVPNLKRDYTVDINIS